MSLLIVDGKVHLKLYNKDELQKLINIITGYYHQLQYFAVGGSFYYQCLSILVKGCSQVKESLLRIGK